MNTTSVWLQSRTIWDWTMVNADLVDRRLLSKVVGTVHTNMEPWCAGLLAVKDYIVLSNT